MAELKLLSEVESRSAVGDWAMRGGVALVYFIFGFEKFSSDPGSHWVALFREIGVGDWFRYAAGVVEVLGGLLVLIPRTALVGLALLGGTMACAILILTFELHRPGDSVFPGIFLIALVGVGWKQYSSRRESADSKRN